jgi:hypothetical protein
MRKDRGMSKPLTDKDRQRARICLEKCPVCRSARAEQKGGKYWFVKNVESWSCPWCKAYAKVYGRKAYEPLTGHQTQE